VRSFFRCAGFDFESIEDVIPPFSDGMNAIMIEWLDNTGTVQQNPFTWNDVTAPFVVTVKSLADSLFTHFQDSIRLQSRRQYRRIFGYNTNGNTRIRATYNLAAAKVSVLNTSSLKIQNSSASTHGATGDVVPGDVEDEDSENINALPLKGVMYMGKGTYTGLRPYAMTTNDNTMATARAIMGYELVGDPQNGFMTMRAPGSDTGATLQRFYANPPPASQMTRVIGTGNVGLEPGDLKSDTLVFRFEGTLNMFLAHIIDAGQVSNVANLFSRSSLGHFKLFGFEKKLHSTRDKILVRYEVNKILRAKVFIPRESPSLVHNTDRMLVYYSNNAVAP
jgi:hypothetical protein